MDRLALGLLSRIMTNNTILVIGSTGKTGRYVRAPKDFRTYARGAATTGVKNT